MSLDDRRVAARTNHVDKAGGANPHHAADGSAVDAAQAGEATAQQIRGSSLLMAGRLVALIATLLVQVLTVRYLSRADYGAFAYALSFTTTARIVVTLGTNRTLTRFLSIYDERREHDKLFGTIAMMVGIILSAATVLFISVFLLRDWLAATVVDDPLAITVLLIILLLAPVDALDDLTEGLFAVFAKPRQIFVRRYLVSPALKLTVIGILILTGSGVLILAAGYVLAGVLGVCFYASSLVRVLRSKGLLEHLAPRRITMPFREVFSFSVPLLSTELVVISMNTVSAMILGYFHGTVAVGAFRAVRPAAVLNQFVSRNFNLLFLPLASRLYARGDHMGMRQAYWHTAVWLAVFTFPIFAMTSVFAEQTTVALFGERYQDSAIVLALLSLGYYFNVCLGFNALILQVYGRLRYLLTVNVSASVYCIVVSFLLISRFGVVGIALAACSTLVLQNILNQAGLGRGIGVGMFHWQYLRVYASVIVAAGALFLLDRTTSPNFPLSVALSGLASAGVFFVNLRMLRIADTFPKLRGVPILGRILDTSA